MTYEPCPSPLSDIDIYEMRTFQEEFITAIKQKDLINLPSYIDNAKSRSYADALEGLICWAELVLKEGLSTPREQRLEREDNARIMKRPSIEIMYERNLKGQLIPNLFPKEADSSLMTYS